MNATLIVLSGLPGTGKTTVGRGLARHLGAVFLRIDSIEQPMLAAGWSVEGKGYEAAQAVAEDNLRLGNTVIADCVNPWPMTRAAWRAVAARASARAVDVEFVCSDAAAHKARIEERRAAEPTRGWPSWQDVLDRDYRPWDTERLIVDTAHLSPDAAISLLLATLNRRTVEP